MGNLLPLLFLKITEWQTIKKENMERMKSQFLKG